MSRLQGLLESTGREEGRVALADLLAALVDELDATSDTRVVLAVGTPDVRLVGHAALALSLIVTELVLNAEKHAFRDGREGIVTVEATAEGKAVVLTVSDNGTGLPPCFKPGNGAGLGMRVVLDQVAKLDGRLETGRSVSGGARFRVFVPR
jgi:two-component sensor histidine kinase